MDGIIGYIIADSPLAAGSVAERILQTAAGLGEMATGRRGRVGGTYEKLVAGLPYILAYAVDGRPSGGGVVILHVIDATRHWPDHDWPSQG